MAQLPQELVDAIVCELDTPSLTTCAHTAKTFAEPCQRRIFYTMVLRSEEPEFTDRTYRRASELFSSAPHLAAYVRDFNAVWPIDPGDTRPFEAVLRSLSNVRRFTISTAGPYVGWDWDEAVPTAAIFDMLSLPSLDRFHMLRILNVPPSLIYHAASSVRVLSLDPCPDRENGAPSSLFSTTPPQLEHLNLLSSRSTRHLSEFVLMLSGDGYLQKIQRLALTAGGVAYESSRDLLESVSATLRHLEITYGRHDHVPIPQMKHLQFLELSFYIGTSRVLPPDLDLIVAKLPELTPILESFTFTLRMIPQMQETLWVSDGPWPVFDVGFTERGALPRLRRVTCCLHRIMDYFHSGRNVSYDGFVATMRTKLCGLDGSGMLNFAQRTSDYRFEDGLP
ncbi:hypothetical protein C8R46DRAFT_1118920 [Mycena filopes]|nr:hypothetical protein C8R46DRAFT_1118920 [Mycena filopes]